MGTTEERVAERRIEMEQLARLMMEATDGQKVNAVVVLVDDTVEIDKDIFSFCCTGAVQIGAMLLADGLRDALRRMHQDVVSDPRMLMPTVPALKHIFATLAEAGFMPNDDLMKRAIERATGTSL